MPSSLPLIGATITVAAVLVALAGVAAAAAQPGRADRPMGQHRLPPIRNFVSHLHVSTRAAYGAVPATGETWEYFRTTANGSDARDDVISATPPGGPTVGNWTSITPCRFGAPTDPTYRIGADGTCTRGTDSRAHLKSCDSEFADIGIVRLVPNVTCFALGQPGTLYAFDDGPIAIRYCMRSPSVVLGFNVSNATSGYLQTVEYFYFKASDDVDPRIFDIPTICNTTSTTDRAGETLP